MSNEALQFITIDDVQYDVNQLTPQIRGTINLLEAARQRMQNSQIELAMNQAASNHFATELRTQLEALTLKPRRSPAKKKTAVESTSRRPVRTKKKN